MKMDLSWNDPELVEDDPADGDATDLLAGPAAAATHADLLPPVPMWRPPVRPADGDGEDDERDPGERLYAPTVVREAALAGALQEAAVYKTDDHPRWPKGTPGGKGGEWMKIGELFTSGGKTWQIASIVKGRVYAHEASGSYHKVETKAFDAKPHDGQTEVPGVEYKPPVVPAGGKSQSSQVTVIDPYVDPSTHDPSIPIPAGSLISAEEWKRFGKLDQEHYTELMERFGPHKPGAAKKHIDQSYADYEAAVQTAVKKAYQEQYGASTGYSLSMAAGSAQVASTSSYASKKLGAVQLSGHGLVDTPELAKLREKALALQAEHKAAVQWDLYNRTRSPDVFVVHKSGSTNPSQWNSKYIEGDHALFSGLSQSFHYRRHFFGSHGIATPLAIRHVLMSSNSAQPVPGETHFTTELEVSVLEQLKVDKRSFALSAEPGYGSHSLSATQIKWLEGITQEPQGGHVLEQLREAIESGGYLPIPPAPPTLTMDGSSSKTWVDPPAEAAVPPFDVTGLPTSFSTTIDAQGLPKDLPWLNADADGVPQAVPGSGQVQPGQYFMGLKGTLYWVGPDPGDAGPYPYRIHKIENGKFNGEDFDYNPDLPGYYLDAKYVYDPDPGDDVPAFDPSAWVPSTESKFMEQFQPGEKFKLNGNYYEVTGSGYSGSVKVKALDSDMTGTINGDYKATPLVAYDGSAPTAADVVAGPAYAPGMHVLTADGKGTVAAVDEDGSLTVDVVGGYQLELAPGDVSPWQEALQPKVGLTFPYTKDDGSGETVKATVTKITASGDVQINLKPGKVVLDKGQWDSMHAQEAFDPSAWVIGGEKVKLRDMQVGDRFQGGQGSQTLRPYEVVKVPSQGKVTVRNLDTGEVTEMSRHVSFRKLEAKPAPGSAAAATIDAPDEPAAPVSTPVSADLAEHFNPAQYEAGPVVPWQRLEPGAFVKAETGSTFLITENNDGNLMVVGIGGGHSPIPLDKDLTETLKAPTVWVPKADGGSVTSLDDPALHTPDTGAKPVGDLTWKAGDKFIFQFGSTQGATLTAVADKNAPGGGGKFKNEAGEEVTLYNGHTVVPLPSEAPPGADPEDHTTWAEGSLKAIGQMEPGTIFKTNSKKGPAYYKLSDDGEFTVNLTTGKSYAAKKHWKATPLTPPSPAASPEPEAGLPGPQAPPVPESKRFKPVPDGMTPETMPVGTWAATSTDLEDPQPSFALQKINATHWQMYEDGAPVGAPTATQQWHFDGVLLPDTVASQTTGMTGAQAVAAGPDQLGPATAVGDLPEGTWFKQSAGDDAAFQVTGKGADVNGGPLVLTINHKGQTGQYGSSFTVYPVTGVAGPGPQPTTPGAMQLGDHFKLTPDGINTYKITGASSSQISYLNPETGAAGTMNADVPMYRVAPPVSAPKVGDPVKVGALKPGDQFTTGATGTSMAEVVSIQGGQVYVKSANAGDVVGFPIHPGTDVFYEGSASASPPVPAPVQVPAGDLHDKPGTIVSHQGAVMTVMGGMEGSHLKVIYPGGELGLLHESNQVEVQAGHGPTKPLLPGTRVKVADPNAEVSGFGTVAKNEADAVLVNMDDGSTEVPFGAQQLNEVPLDLKPGNYVVVDHDFGKQSLGGHVVKAGYVKTVRASDGYVQLHGSVQWFPPEAVTDMDVAAAKFHGGVVETPDGVVGHYVGLTEEPNGTVSAMVDVSGDMDVYHFDPKTLKPSNKPVAAQAGEAQMPAASVAKSYAELQPGDSTTLGALQPGDQVKSGGSTLQVLSKHGWGDDGTEPHVKVALVNPDGSAAMDMTSDASPGEPVTLKGKASTPQAGPVEPSAPVDVDSLPDAVEAAGFVGYKSHKGSGGKWSHHMVKTMPEGTIFADLNGKQWKVKQAGPTPVITDGQQLFKVNGQLRGKDLNQPAVAAVPTLIDNSPGLEMPPEPVYGDMPELVGNINDKTLADLGLEPGEHIWNAAGAHAGRWVAKSDFSPTYGQAFQHVASGKTQYLFGGFKPDDVPAHKAGDLSYPEFSDLPLPDVTTPDGPGKVTEPDVGGYVEVTTSDGVHLHLPADVHPAEAPAPAPAPPSKAAAPTLHSELTPVWKLPNGTTFTVAMGSTTVYTKIGKNEYKAPDGTISKTVGTNAVYVEPAAAVPAGASAPSVTAAAGSMTKAKLLKLADAHPGASFTLVDQKGNVHEDVQIASAVAPPSAGGGWGALGAFAGVKQPAPPGKVWMKKGGGQWKLQPAKAAVSMTLQDEQASPSEKPISEFKVGDKLAQSGMAVTAVEPAYLDPKGMTTLTLKSPKGNTLQHTKSNDTPLGWAPPDPAPDPSQPIDPATVTAIDSATQFAPPTPVPTDLPVADADPLQPFGSHMGPGGVYPHPMIKNLQPGQLFTDKSGHDFKVVAQGEGFTTFQDLATGTVHSTKGAHRVKATALPPNPGPAVMKVLMALDEDYNGLLNVPSVDLTGFASATGDGGTVKHPRVGHLKYGEHFQDAAGRKGIVIASWLNNTLVLFPNGTYRIVHGGTRVLKVPPPS